jgi:hypothetical protein
VFFCVKQGAGVSKPLMFTSSLIVGEVVNTVAHCLSQFGFRADAECFGWADVVSPFVSDLVDSDIAVHRG